MNTLVVTEHAENLEVLEENLVSTELFVDPESRAALNRTIEKL